MVLRFFSKLFTVICNGSSWLLNAIKSIEAVYKNELQQQIWPMINNNNNIIDRDATFVILYFVEEVYWKFKKKTHILLDPFINSLHLTMSLSLWTFYHECNLD